MLWRISRYAGDSLLFPNVTGRMVIFYTDRAMAAERTVSISFRVTPKFRSLLVAAAERENRSLTNMLETLLLEFCAEHGIEQPSESDGGESSAPVEEASASTKSVRLTKAKPQS